MTDQTKRIYVYILMVVLFFPLCGRDFVHVFTSKGIYETCEDLWFKCVAFDDSTMLISDHSHTAYVEIVDPTDSVVWREKYRMSSGMCDGHAFVGEDWKPGEYRMFVHTRGSLGRGDTVVYPKRLLIVSELPEVPGYLSSARERMSYIDIPDSVETGSLNVTVMLDSTEYHARSKVRATVRVTDTDGNPVRTVIAMSVADALYSYPPADINAQSQTYGILHDTVRTLDCGFEPLLSDAVVSGYLRSERKKNTDPLDGKFINVFDDIAEKGTFNITNTVGDGYFEVSSEMGSSLGRTLLLKPLVNEDMKPKLELDNPFRDISDLRKGSSEKYYPVLRKTRLNEPIDTLDYSGRHTVHLKEIVVKSKGGRFTKRNKVMGYLDSLALNMERAWTCGCHGAFGSTYLNDYIEGYTHHPNGTGTVKKRGKPQRGVTYELIKYSGPTMSDYVVDIKYMEYEGPRYSEEELLRMNGIWKADGYHARHRFRLPSEDELLPGIEDSRNTLLWLPRAQTNENGEFTIEFPASDISSTFRVAVFVLMPDIKDATTINEYFSVK